jgi:carbonic anhydrase
VTTTYKNDGHGYAAKVSFASSLNPNITGGPLGSDVYTFFNFHIHWPSEHTLDGESFPAELHIVHYNLKYGSIGNAISQPDGLAVVGVFFEVSCGFC